MKIMWGNERLFHLIYGFLFLFSFINYGCLIGILFLLVLVLLLKAWEKP